MSALLDGIAFKLQEADFYRGKICQVLVPASTGSNPHAYYVSSTISVRQWAPDFYYYFDAFLAAARSIDYVVQATFGVDNL